MSDGIKFERIVLGARGTSQEGTLSISEAGVSWKKKGGMSPQVFKKSDLLEALWSLAPAGGLLRLRQNDKVTINLHGFAKGEEGRLKDALHSKLDMDLVSQPMHLSGHNWGNVKVHGSSVAFQSLDGKAMFELPLTEVADVQGGKEDAIMEFHVDDGTISMTEDALCSVTFVIPEGNSEFPGNVEEEKTAADVFRAAIMDKTDTLSGEGDALAELPHVSCVFPRGRFDLSMYPGFMDMDGQNSQFKIRYSNIDRIYQLPRPQPPGALVIIHLENAIRRGQTYYEWIAFFFDTNAYVDDLPLNTSEEFLAKKNEENRANMEAVMSGPKEDVLTRMLRGLSGAKVTKQGKFMAFDESPFLACNYKNDAGVLYPLQRAFLYTFKPELVPYDHIESVEFERQQSGLHASNVKTFDLSISIRADAATRTKNFLFRGILKQEWEPLLTFMENKNVRIANLDQARQGPSFAPGARPLAGIVDDDDDDEDEFAAGGVDEEDEDFKGAGASSEDSSDNESDAELIPEEGISVEAVGGKPSKRSRKEAEDDVEDAVSADEEDDAEVSEDDEEEEEEPVKKPVKKKAAKPSKKADEKPKKKKKDPNEPKRGMSAFMFFSNAKRAEVKEDNPGIAFGEVGKKLGEMWKALDSDGRKTFDEQAAKDKSRYEKEIAAYRAKQGGDDGQAFRGSGKEAELALSDEDGDTELSEDDEEHEPPPKKAAKRKKKDPNEPKRGMSAFMFFANAKRAEVKEDNPGIAFGEIGKKLGEMWKTLDSDGRKSFDEQAAKDKSRYATEIALYRTKQ